MNPTGRAVSGERWRLIKPLSPSAEPPADNEDNTMPAFSFETISSKIKREPMTASKSTPSQGPDHKLGADPTWFRRVLDTMAEARMARTQKQIQRQAQPRAKKSSAIS